MSHTNGERRANPDGLCGISRKVSETDIRVKSWEVLADFDTVPRIPSSCGICINDTTGVIRTMELQRRAGLLAL